jgi:hypothetical protein
MKHRTTEELQQVAAIHSVPRDVPMTRAERLTRWAELLESDGGRRLNTLLGTEYQMGAVRDEMRADASPISVAFSDPALRGEGMNNDTYGEAKRFFDLSDWQVHDILCYCHYGATMTAEMAARGVRSAIAGRQNPGFFSRVRHVIGA